MLARVDALTVSLVSLGVTFVLLIFGTAIGPRAWTAIREHLKARVIRKTQIQDYLTTACVFIDGLPLFIEQTWDWGPSVPNYSAGGKFPGKAPLSGDEMQLLHSAVQEALAFYGMHSQKQGKPFGSKEEGLQRLAEIQQRFWESLEAFARKEWRVRWRRVVAQRREQRLPDSERARILNLERC